jgi:hypothetical protein
MNKQTKTIIGLAAVAGIGYYVYSQYKKKNPFANVVSDKPINYRKAGSVCHYYVGDELMKGRVNSYDNSMCEGTSTRGKLI